MLGLDRQRAIHVLSSVLQSETFYGTRNFDAALAGETVARHLTKRGSPRATSTWSSSTDAFTVEELLYIEAMGLCKPGQAAECTRRRWSLISAVG